jgi:hypothetical protein
MLFIALIGLSSIPVQNSQCINLRVINAEKPTYARAENKYSLPSSLLNDYFNRLQELSKHFQNSRHGFELIDVIIDMCQKRKDSDSFL